MAADVIINIKAVDQTKGVFEGIGSAISKMAAVAVAAGTAAFAVMAKGALDATAEYEKLTLQLETLAAREIRNSDSSLSMADALKQSTGAAQELLKWTQELAIHSPFDQTTVANSLQQAMNYGFTSDQAKELTSNLIDMGAGMGWTADKMGLVSYAMGQINQSGTLMTQDLRQLMSAGVPVIDILDTMGYSLEDVGKKSISSADFLAEFNKMVDEDFTGSADRMTKSWSGMISTFDDIKKMGLRTLFADTFEVLQPLIGLFQDWMLGDGLAKLEQWGEGMGKFTQSIIDFVSDPTNFDLSDITGKFKDFMRGVDWQKVSDDFVAGVNSIDWVAVGQEIRTSAANIWKGIKEAAEGIDWAAVSEALGNGLKGVTAGLYGYVDWEALKLDFNNGFAYLFGYDTTTAFEDLKRDFYNGFLSIGEVIGGTILVLTNVIPGMIARVSSAFLSAGVSMMTSLANGIKSGANKVFAEINKIIAKINQMLGGLGVNIPTIPGVTVGGTAGAGGGGATVGGSAGSGAVTKPGNVPQLAGGGIVSGPTSGHLAMLHGTEGVFTREQMAMLSPGGGGVTINLTYAPAFSTASMDELQDKLMPLILKGINQSRRNK